MSVGESLGHSNCQSGGQSFSQSVSESDNNRAIQSANYCIIHLQNRSDFCLLKVYQRGLKLMLTLQMIYYKSCTFIP